MEWKTIFPYSIQAIFFYSISISYQKSSIPILPYQGKFRLEAMRNLHYTFAMLSVLLPVIAHEGKQYGAIHFIPYLKHYRNDLPQKFTQHKNINHRRNQDF